MTKGQAQRFIAITIGWLLTPIYTVIFISILLVFHPLIVLASFFGKSLQSVVLNLMNLSIITNIRLLTGATIKVSGFENLPRDRTIILVANHQSMYDIPILMWHLRTRLVGFVAKKELARWLPSISFSLRTLYSVLIDRKDTASAVKQIATWGKVIDQINGVACIFPEGTRAKDGILKRFKAGGLGVLLEAVNDPVVVPVAISGAWRLLRYNFLPVPFGTLVEVRFLEPIKINKPVNQVIDSISLKISEFAR